MTDGMEETSTNGRPHTAHGAGRTAAARGDSPVTGCADDRVKDFLTVFIAQHNRTPPKNWDGVIDLESK